MYKVIETGTFTKAKEKSSNPEQGWIFRIEKEVSEYPYSGKPLGFKFFREKKFREKRAYYLIYDEYQTVLMVAISDKDNQPAMIKLIKKLMPSYYELVKELDREGKIK